MFPRAMLLLGINVSSGFRLMVSRVLISRFLNVVWLGYISFCSCKAISNLSTETGHFNHFAALMIVDIALRYPRFMDKYVLIHHFVGFICSIALVYFPFLLQNETHPNIVFQISNFVMVRDFANAFIITTVQVLEMDTVFRASQTFFISFNAERDWVPHPNLVRQHKFSA